MRNKDIIRHLRSDDDETIMQISRTYPGLTTEQKERLYKRIRQNLNPPELIETPEIYPMVSHTQPLRRSRRWIEYTAAAASCVLVFGTAIAGLFWMKSLTPSMPPHSETISASDRVLTPNPSGAPGKRYAAEQLTSDGTLWVTVKDIAWENERCRVTVLLESSRAVSIADEGMGEPDLFFAENFLLENQTCQCRPCTFETDGETGDLPNTIVLASGKSCTVTFWYEADPSEHWRFLPRNNQIYTSIE